MRARFIVAKRTVIMMLELDCYNDARRRRSTIIKDSHRGRNGAARPPCAWLSRCKRYRNYLHLPKTGSSGFFQHYQNRTEAILGKMIRLRDISGASSRLEAVNHEEDSVLLRIAACFEEAQKMHMTQDEERRV